MIIEIIIVAIMFMIAFASIIIVGEIGASEKWNKIFKERGRDDE